MPKIKVCDCGKSGEYAVELHLGEWQYSEAVMWLCDDCMALELAQQAHTATFKNLERRPVLF